MIAKKLLSGMIFVGMVSISFGQESSKVIFSPSRLGIEFTQGNEKSFLFDDPDYYYQTNTLKAQFYYPLTQWKKFDISLIVQPQFQWIQHQLYNEQFVLPEVENYIEKRAKYTKLKSLSITAIEFTIDAQKKLFKNTYFFAQFGLGLAIIDTSTERLIGGFTFLENLNLGVEITTSSSTSLRLFGGIGHVSNLNFQLPNSGYNIVNTGISFQYSLQE